MKMIQAYGRTLNLRAWAEELGWSRAALADRLKRLPFHEAMKPKTVDDAGRLGLPTYLAAQRP